MNLNKNQINSAKRQWVAFIIYTFLMLIIIAISIATNIDLINNHSIKYLMLGFVIYLTYISVEAMLFKAIYIGRRYKVKFEIDMIEGYPQNKIAFPVSLALCVVTSIILFYMILF